MLQLFCTSTIKMQSNGIFFSKNHASYNNENRNELALKLTMDGADIFGTTISYGLNFCFTVW